MLADIEKPVPVSNAPGTVDVESLGGDNGLDDFKQQYTPLQRQLKNRHIAMIR